MERPAADAAGLFAWCAELLESGLREHLEELAAGADVDCLGDEFAVAVIDEALGDAFDMERVLQFVSGVEQDGVGDGLGGGILGELGGFFIGDSENDEALTLELLIEGGEVGDFLAAGRTPGGPEVDDDDFAAKLAEGPGGAMEVSEGEVGGGAEAVGGVKLGDGGEIGGTVERCLEALEADELSDFTVGELGVGVNLLEVLNGTAKGGGDLLQYLASAIGLSREAGETGGEADLAEGKGQGSDFGSELAGEFGALFVWQWPELAKLEGDGLLLIGEGRGLGLRLKGKKSDRKRKDGGDGNEAGGEATAAIHGLTIVLAMRLRIEAETASC